MTYKVRRTLSTHSWTVVLIMMVGFSLSQFSCSNGEEGISNEATDAEVSPQRLVGRWLRPDGQYVIEIQKVHSDGKVDAAYLNPRPINVAEAKIDRKQGRLKVLVILRDQGYPGSYYDLLYDPTHDQLVGDYYQATQGSVYDVFFVRLPDQQ